MNKAVDLDLQLARHSPSILRTTSQLVVESGATRPIAADKDLISVRMPRARPSCTAAHLMPLCLANPCARSTPCRGSERSGSSPLVSPGLDPTAWSSRGQILVAKHGNQRRNRARENRATEPSD